MTSSKVDLYIRLDDHVRIQEKRVCLKDIAEVYCHEHQIKIEAEKTEIFTFQKKDGKKEVISFLYVCQRIYNQLGNHLFIHSLGAEDCLVEWHMNKEKNPMMEALKVAFVSLVTFFGAAFSIMTYDQDAGVADVFEKLYTLFQMPESGPGVLEVSYSIGVGLGIIVFFHHFEKKNERTPTAMEIQMNKYEKDMVDSYVKSSERRGESLEVESSKNNKKS